VRAHLVVLLALALALVLPAAADEPTDPWASLLGAGGVAPAEAQLDPSRWRGGGRLPLDPLFERLWGDWQAVAPWAEGLGRELAAAAKRGDLAAVASLATAPLTSDVAVVEDGLAPALDLVAALRALHAGLGMPLDPAGEADLETFAGSVPPDVAAVGAAILAEVPGVLEAHRRSLAPWGEWPSATARSDALSLARYRDVDEALIARLAAQDGAALGLAARRLARGLARARAVWTARPRRAAPAAPFRAVWSTPIGEVLLCGGADDVHSTRPRLLVVDAGGDDVHRAAGASAEGVPVSIVVDLAGNDRHGDPRRSGRVAAGLAGCAALLDLAGDDEYAVSSDGLGCGVLGVGLLVDAQGDDRYVGRHDAAGAGTAGLGLLLDLAGDDRYEGVERIQGFGQTRGVGLLLDLSGADRYVADDTMITNPSPQTAAHNTSLAQGCGFGRRAHPGDERSLAGGLGLLVDARGDDVYRAGVFGQGVGYWYGIGALVDLAGDDDGQAAWYGQGAGAHFAVGCLVDAAGADRHCVALGQGLGQGQDESVGVLADRRGDDRYISSAHALGSAIWNGVGVLDDGAGDDVYECGPFHTLGDPGAHQCREGVRALGLFLDRGGRDTFPTDHPLAKAGATWVWRDPAWPLAVGVGGDLDP
jgi:hypothetical protein